MDVFFFLDFQPKTRCVFASRRKHRARALVGSQYKEQAVCTATPQEHCSKLIRR